MPVNYNAELAILDPFTIIFLFLTFRRAIDVHEFFVSIFWEDLGFHCRLLRDSHHGFESSTLNPMPPTNNSNIMYCSATAKRMYIV